MTDPLYNQIILGLEQLNDGNKFEACVCDLLRKDYPRLVPVTGGSDAGFDGSISQPDGQVVQLICTTQDSVIGNLTGSLEQAKKKGQQSQAILIATSRRLSPTQKRNLGERVMKFGKNLQAIYDQEAFANLLYRDTHWRKELLGLVGAPPAFSCLPVNLRPTFDLKLLGRDAELRAVTEAKRDLVVVGQPGSGKTHLLAEAARATEGLFLVESDPTAMANGLRDQKPKRVVVDDAFSRPEMLTNLCRVRKDIGADFLIIAACWPKQENRIAAQLNIVGEPMVQLEPLAQKIIKEIVTEMRIVGPDHVVHEILHQSAGKPGLAVTLCQLCWRNGTKGLFTGEALARDVKLSLDGIAGPEAVGLLAHFAIAGDAGLSVEAVAGVTGISAISVLRQSEMMSAAGVLEVVEEQRLAVQPTRLRQALVRDVFFLPPALDWGKLVNVVPNRADLIDTIIAAGLLGGRIDDERLRALLIDLGRGSLRFAELCDHYARLGTVQSRWVLTTHPELAERAAEPLLEHIPEEAIPVLIRNAQQTARLERHLRQELKPLRQWIDDKGNTDESLPRRVLLLGALENMQMELAGSSALLAGVRHLLSLEFEWHRQTPGDPHQFSLISGVASENNMQAIAGLWPRAKLLLNGLPREQAVRLPELVGDWAHPGSRVRELQEAYRVACRPHAVRMLEDLLAMYAGQWAIVRRFDLVAKQLGCPLPAAELTLAGQLFPGRDLDLGPEAHRRNEAAAAKLAGEWEVAGPQPDFVADWVRIDAEAREAGVNYPNVGRMTAYFLARDTKRPADWLAALTKAGAPADLIEPFVERCSSESDTQRRAFITEQIRHPDYGGLAIEQLVRSIPSDDPLWTTAAPLLSEHEGRINTAVLRDLVPEATLLTLLTDNGPVIARGAAAELWSAQPKGEIPEGLREAWRNVVVTHLENNHELAEIARAHPDLACAWIKRRLNRTWQELYAEGDFGSYQHFPAMIAALNREQRREIIDQFAADNFQGNLLDQLIGDDLELFRHALSRPETRRRASQCLGLPGNPVTFWVERATLLLDEGFSERDVLGASDLVSGGWVGPRSRYFEEKRQSFLPLLDHTDPRIRRIGQMADQFLQEHRDEELKNEHRAAVRGELA